MILTGTKIFEEVNKGSIKIDPFNESQINPNSYDFKLSDKLAIYEKKTLDAKYENNIVMKTIPETGVLLEPNRLYLGCTIEKIGSDNYVPIVRGKSSTGRLGLFIFITADLIDIGSYGRITLMMHAVQPVKIYPNMLIGQVTFWKVYGKINLYKGKYQGSKEPVKSLIHLDFEKE